MLSLVNLPKIDSKNDEIIDNLFDHCTLMPILIPSGHPPLLDHVKHGNIVHVGKCDHATEPIQDHTCSKLINLSLTFATMIFSYQCHFQK